MFDIVSIEESTLTSPVHVLVTGASGFIGTATCLKLLECGMHVHAAVRSETPALEGVEQAFIEEIGPDTVWRETLAGVEVVIHLAARAHVMRNSGTNGSTLFHRTNTLGTVRLAREAAAMGVKRFVFVSSIGVNGAKTTQHPFTPDDPPAPHSLYAHSKYAAEKELQRIANESGMEVVIIRPPLVYGPHAPGNFGRLLKWVKRGLPLPFGAINNKRSFVALENLVDLISLCADRNKSPKAANEIFLISDGEDISTPELLKRVAKAYGKTSCLIPIPSSFLRVAARLIGKAALAESLIDSLTIDNTKSKNLLGWQPVVSMEEQLRKIAQAQPIL